MFDLTYRLSVVYDMTLLAKLAEKDVLFVVMALYYYAANKNFESVNTKFTILIRNQFIYS